MTDMLEAPVDDWTEPAEEPIVDLNDLARAFRQVADCDSRIGEIRETARREKERIDVWEEDATRADLRRRAYFESLIRGFALRRIAETKDQRGAKKSITTPYGEVSVKAAPSPEFIKDDAELLAWAEVNGYTRTQPAETVVDWARIRKEAKVDGSSLVVEADTLNARVVPGVHVVAKDPIVTVRPYR